MRSFGEGEERKREGKGSESPGTAAWRGGRGRKKQPRSQKAASDSGGKPEGCSIQRPKEESVSTVMCWYLEKNSFTEVDGNSVGKYNK